jgi:hypothetical protein
MDAYLSRLDRYSRAPHRHGAEVVCYSTYDAVAS